MPTDAEWSVAVGLGKEKGNTPEEKEDGNKGVYPWGKEWPPPKGLVNFGTTHTWTYNVDNFKYTSPVGRFAANKIGLHDMGGNVGEWCEDKWNPSGRERVQRGASWFGNISEYWMSSYRGTGRPGDRYPMYGFRCVLVGE